MTIEITPQLIITAGGVLTAILAIVGIIIRSVRWMDERKKRGEPPMKTANKVLILLGCFVLAFVVTMIITYWRFQSVPDTLIQYTLGAGGVEALALAGIKISKVWREKQKDEDIDDE